jgi:hypothetical protein
MTLMKTDFAQAAHAARMETAKGLAQVAGRALAGGQHDKCCRALKGMAALIAESDRLRLSSGAAAGDGFMLEVVSGLLDECLESIELDRPDWACAVYDLPQIIERLQAS